MTKPKAGKTMADSTKREILLTEWMIRHNELRREYIFQQMEVSDGDT